jgi:hypothetical protein
MVLEFSASKCAPKIKLKSPPNGGLFLSLHTLNGSETALTSVCKTKLIRSFCRERDHPCNGHLMHSFAVGAAHQDAITLSTQFGTNLV